MIKIYEALENIFTALKVPELSDYFRILTSCDGGYARTNIKQKAYRDSVSAPFSRDNGSEESDSGTTRAHTTENPHIRAGNVSRNIAGSCFPGATTRIRVLYSWGFPKYRVL